MALECFCYIYWRALLCLHPFSIVHTLLSLSPTHLIKDSHVRPCAKQSEKGSVVNNQRCQVVKVVAYDKEKRQVKIHFISVTAVKRSGPRCSVVSVHFYFIIKMMPTKQEIRKNNREAYRVKCHKQS